MNNELEKSIYNLYDVFSIYEANPDMPASPVYGNIEGWKRELFGKDVKELSSEELSRFTGKVLSTWGESNDLKHFIPRILELTAQYDAPHDIIIIFAKLNNANWKDWKINEFNAINEYLYVLWKFILDDTSVNAEYNFIDYFSIIFNNYSATSKLLDFWTHNKTDTSIKYLTNLILNHYVEIFDLAYCETLKLPKSKLAVLKEWILAKETCQIIESAYFTYEDEEFRSKITNAESILKSTAK